MVSDHGPWSVPPAVTLPTMVEPWLTMVGHDNMVRCSQGEAAEWKATYLKHESKVYPQVIETI